MQPTFATPPSFFGVARNDREAPYCVAGVPFDIGTSNRPGARFGPHAIRHASRMLLDGAHPVHWIDPTHMPIADIGDFRIALGDVQALGHLLGGPRHQCRQRKGGGKTFRSWTTATGAEHINVVSVPVGAGRRGERRSGAHG